MMMKSGIWTVSKDCMRRDYVIETFIGTTQASEKVSGSRRVMVVVRILRFQKIRFGRHSALYRYHTMFSAIALFPDGDSSSDCSIHRATWQEIPDVLSSLQEPVPQILSPSEAIHKTVTDGHPMHKSFY